MLHVLKLSFFFLIIHFSGFKFNLRILVPRKFKNDSTVRYLIPLYFDKKLKKVILIPPQPTAAFHLNAQQNTSACCRVLVEYFCCILTNSLFIILKIERKTSQKTPQNLWASTRCLCHMCVL